MKKKNNLLTFNLIILSIITITWAIFIFFGQQHIDDTNGIDSYPNTIIFDDGIFEDEYGFFSYISNFKCAVENVSNNIKDITLCNNYHFNSKKTSGVLLLQNIDEDISSEYFVKIDISVFSGNALILVVANNYTILDEYMVDEYIIQIKNYNQSYQIYLITESAEIDLSLNVQLKD